jgi:hypothetical protein
VITHFGCLITYFGKVITRFGIVITDFGGVAEGITFRPKQVITRPEIRTQRNDRSSLQRGKAWGLFSLANNAHS